MLYGLVSAVARGDIRFTQKNKDKKYLIDYRLIFFKETKNKI